jgi:hypothetical protein
MELARRLLHRQVLEQGELREDSDLRGPKTAAHLALRKLQRPMLTLDLLASLNLPLCRVLEGHPSTRASEGGALAHCVFPLKALSVSKESR